MKELKRIRFTLAIVLFVFMVASASIASAAEKDWYVEEEDYRIGKSDVLEVNVWKQEGLSRTVNVRKDGKITLPLIHDVQAAGRTPMKLKDEIQQKMSRYIETPSVTVIVQSQNSQQFYVVGNIANTGAYPLTKDLTIVQGITLAGGFTEWADRDDILLLRRTEGEKKRIDVDYYEIVSGESKEQNIMLQADDTIIVR